MRAASQEYVVECGGPPDAMRGWSATAESRRDGSTAGHQDVYYFNANNKRFRSRVEVGAERGSPCTGCCRASAVERRACCRRRWDGSSPHFGVRAFGVRALFQFLTVVVVRSGGVFRVFRDLFWRRHTERSPDTRLCAISGSSRRGRSARAAPAHRRARGRGRRCGRAAPAARHGGGWRSERRRRRRSSRGRVPRRDAAARAPPRRTSCRPASRPTMTEQRGRGTDIIAAAAAV